MALGILAINQAAQNLLDCVCAALQQLPSEAPGLMGCPSGRGVVPGAQVAADGCDAGCEPLGPDEYPGQLTVHVVRIYSSDYQAFPREVAQVRDNRKCLPPQTTAVELAVTVFRCAPLPTDEGCPPTAQELSETALQQHADMLAVQAAILCCYASTDQTRLDGRRYVIGQSASVGPQGGCVGFEQRVTVALDDCIDCDPSNGQQGA